MKKKKLLLFIFVFVISFLVYPEIGQAVGEDIWIVSTGGEGAFQTLLDDDYEVTVKTTDEIKTDGIPSSVELLIYPGGLLPIVQAQDDDLQTAIKDYVNNGGNYFGSCGGSIPGAVNMTWDSGVIDMIGLVQLNVYDYLTWASAGYSGNFIFNNNELNGDYASQTEWLTYTGGPAFEVIEGYEDDIEVLATYEGDIYSSDSIDTTGLAAIVMASYGQGKVILSGPHPESNDDTKFLFFNFIDYLLEVNTAYNLVNIEKGVYRATIGWDEVNQADSYNVRYYKNNIEIGVISSFTNKLELEELVSAGKYYWQVQAVSGDIDSDWSDKKRLVTYPRKVKKTEFIFPKQKREVNRLRIRIKTMSKRMTGFNVLVYKNKDNKWTKVKTVKVKNNSSKNYVYKYIDELQVNVEYKFKVKARRKIGAKKFLSQKTVSKYFTTVIDMVN